MAEIAEAVNARPDMQTIIDEINRQGDSFAAFDEAGEKTAETDALSDSSMSAAGESVAAPAALDPDSQAAKTFEKLSQM